MPSMAVGVVEVVIDAGEALVASTASSFCSAATSATRGAVEGSLVVAPEGTCKQGKH